MTTLEGFLQSDAVKNLSDADALAYGNETVVISEDSSRWSYAGVAQRFGATAAEAIGAAMQAAGLATGVITYATVGIALNDPRTQANLAAIAASTAGATPVDNGKTLADVCGELRAIGIARGTRWQQQNLVQPMLEDITAARAAIANEAAIQSFSDLCQSVIAQWRGGAIGSIEQAKNLIVQG